MLVTLSTILKWAILLPVFLVIVLLAVANDQMVTLHLNPFDAADRALSADLALYQLGFIMFVLGPLAGGLVVWVGQRKYRRQARRTRAETARWQAREEWTAAPRPSEPQAGAALLPRPERG
jgi:uncharacterized integral membrane protein